VVLTSESVDKILWCNHSNETSSAVLSQGTIYFVGFKKKMKFVIFLAFLLLVTTRSESYILASVQPPWAAVQMLAHNWPSLLNLYLLNDCPF